MNNRVDWSLIEVFLAVVDEGSFLAAAEKLQQSQPTLGRHITALEESLGQILFVRGRTGALPTAAAEALLPHARAMKAAAQNLTLSVDGQTDRLEGVVRVTASEVVSTYVLPEILGSFLKAHPKIEVELVASNSSANLLQREADIAVRMTAPDQLDVVSRKIGELRIGLFAHETYLANAPGFAGFEDIKNHIVLGYDRSDLMVRSLNALGVPARNRDFRLRSDDQSLHLEYLRRGVGVVATQVKIAQMIPGIVHIMPDLPLPKLPMHLLMHSALRRAAPVRALYDHLGDGLTRWVKEGG